MGVESDRERLVNEMSGASTAADGVDEFDQVQLTAMPLSGITHRFGVEGLTKRFMIALDDLSEPDRDACRRALGLAKYLHRNDVYAEHPYATRLLRVAIRLIRDYGVTEPSVITAAVLHDSLEDHPDELIELAVRAGFNPEDGFEAVAALTDRITADLIQGVTNPLKPPDLTESQRRALYADNVRTKIAESFEVYLIKLSDFTDNAVGLHWSEGQEIIVRLAQKYLPVFQIFLDQTATYEASGFLGPSEAAIARSQLTAGARQCRRFLALSDSAGQSVRA